MCLHSTSFDSRHRAHSDNRQDEKLVAENYLKKSGIDYTIVRPGGLKAKPPTGALKISGEDTLNSGEISRDLVADVTVASLTDKKASNKVLGE